MNNKTKSLPKNLLTIENRVNPFTNALPVFNEGKQLLDSGNAIDPHLERWGWQGGRKTVATPGIV